MAAWFCIGELKQFMKIIEIVRCLERTLYFIRLVDTYLTAFIYKWRHWRWRKSGFWILTTINSIYLNTSIIAPLLVSISDAIKIQSTFSLQITFNRNSILHGPALKLSLLKTNNSIQIMQICFWRREFLLVQT